MIIVNIAQPLTIILLLALTGLLIYWGKEAKKPQIPAVMLVIFLALVLMHSIQLNMVENGGVEYNIVLKCIPIDLIFVLLYFFAYLWVDDVAAKALNKKNIDSSMDWFWKKV